jgi:hypothetical protein
LVRYTPKKICRSRANQKFGIDKPTKAALVKNWSKNEYWRKAEYTPIDTPTRSEKPTATRPRTTVFIRADWMSG